MASKGYLLGKLFALLEREGAVDNRAYQTACVSPTPVIVQGFQNLARMGKMGKPFYDSLESGELDPITEVGAALPLDALDGEVLSPSDQADFPLGYFQEKARERRETASADEEETFNAQLLVRLDPALKNWALEHGGSKLVRTLLRRARDRQRYMPFEEAREFVQKLKSEGQTDAPRLREYLPFEEARAFVRGLGLENSEEWKAYCRSGQKPTNIPAAPVYVYRDEFQGYGDWLGSTTSTTPDEQQER